MWKLHCVEFLLKSNLNCHFTKCQIDHKFEFVISQSVRLVKTTNDLPNDLEDLKLSTLANF